MAQSHSGLHVGRWHGILEPVLDLVDRDAENLLALLNTTTGISTAAKEGARGVAETFEGLADEYLALRGKNGAPTQINADPTVLSPFESRDSVFNYAIGRLDDAITHLNAAGTTFSFSITADGFTGFDTPATFSLVNRAIAARINVERQTFGDAACPGVTLLYRRAGRLDASGVVRQQLVAEHRSADGLLDGLG